MKLTAIMMSLFAMVATVGANAATAAASDMQMHEVLFNITRATGAAVTFGGAPTGGNSTTTMAVSGGYNYHVFPGLQIGLQQFSLGYASNNGTSVTTWDFLAGVTVNWPFTDRLENAFFLAAGAGLVHTPAFGTAASSNDFQWGVEVGKRFTIVDHVNYRPSVQMLKHKDVSAQFVINVLAFSATF